MNDSGFNVDPKPPTGIDVQAMHDFAQSHQKQAVQNAAIAAGAYAAYRFNEKQNRQIELQEQILLQQRITNLLTLGYRIEDIDRLFAQEAATDAAEEAAREARNWAIARAVVPWIVIVLGATSLTQIIESATNPASSSHPGAFEWICVVMGALCLAWQAAKARTWFHRMQSAAAKTVQPEAAGNDQATTRAPHRSHQEWVEDWRQQQASRRRETSNGHSTDGDDEKAVGQT